LITIVLAGVPAADSGAASGVLLTATQIAHACSVTLIGGFFIVTLGADPGDGGLAFDDYAQATAAASCVAVALALVTAATTRRLAD
jgi:hypothetical protein